MSKRLVAPINWRIEKVISGGQVGADIAGVRAAKALGIPTAGYMPLGYLTHGGMRPEYSEEFGMVELVGGTYKTRTWANVQASDGTIRFAYNWNSPGELCTYNAVLRYGKPCLDIEPRNPFKPRKVAEWVRDHEIKTLNIAGNADPVLEVFVESYLKDVLRLLWGKELGA